MILTVASFVVPADTPVGKAPKPSFTLSPSSFSLSEAATKVISFSVSPLLNSMLPGTPL